MKKLIICAMFAFAISACKDKEVEPVKSEISEAEKLSPMVGAVVVSENLYIVMQDGLQFVAFYNPGGYYQFYYYSKEIKFLAERSGDDIYITYNGVKFRARQQFRNK